MRNAWPALLALGIIAACSNQNATPPPSSASAQSAPAPAISMGAGRQVAADLPMLPFGADRGVRSPEVVRATYEFAARHPEVLQYIPCFCSCEQMGHRGNVDCFVESRDSSGKVTQWSTHALGCEVCLDVAQKTMQMHNGGASTWAIREAVEKEFASSFPNHTPTPMPPHKGTSHEE